MILTEGEVSVDAKGKILGPVSTESLKVRLDAAAVYDQRPVSYTHLRAHET